MQIICAICCELFTNDHVKSVSCCPCGHIFHSSCINQWFEREKTCPECRQEIKDKNPIQLFFNVEPDCDNPAETTESLRSKIDDLSCQLYVKDADLKSLRKEHENLTEQKQKLQSRLKEVQINHQITVSTLENRTQCLNAVKRKIEEQDENHKRLKTEEQEIIRNQKREIEELVRINEILQQKLNADYQDLDESEVAAFSRIDFDLPSSSVGLKSYHKSYRNLNEDEASGTYSSFPQPFNCSYKHQEPAGSIQPISLVKNQPYHGHTPRSHSDQPIRAHQSSYIPHSSKSHPSQFHPYLGKPLPHPPSYARSRPPFDSFSQSSHPYTQQSNQQNDNQASCSNTKSNVPIHLPSAKSDMSLYNHLSSSAQHSFQTYSPQHKPPWLGPVQQSGFVNSESHPHSFVQRYSSSYQYPKEQEDIFVFPSTWVFCKTVAG